MTIPKAVRDQYGFSEGDYLVLESKGDHLIVRKGQLVANGTSDREDFETLAERIAQRLEEQGISHSDVEDAIQWARSTKSRTKPTHTDEDVVASQTTIKPRTRVRLRDSPIGVQLRSMSGYVEYLELSDGYYIVRLDEPAIYFHADGTTEDLPAIREAGDNLIVEHLEQ